MSKRNRNRNKGKHIAKMLRKHIERPDWVESTKSALTPREKAWKEKNCGH